MSHHSDKRLSDMPPTDERIILFAREIERQENIVYGVALFFECLTVLHSGHPGIVETYRKQFRNIIQNSRETIQRATAILEETKANPEAIRNLEAFRFSPCHDHPDPSGMVRRAELLISEYNKLFPDRPRSTDFTTDETLRLLENAAAAFDA